MQELDSTMYFTNCELYQFSSKTRTCFPIWAESITVYIVSDKFQLTFCTAEQELTSANQWSREPGGLGGHGAGRGGAGRGGHGVGVADAGWA